MRDIKGYEPCPFVDSHRRPLGPPPSRDNTGGLKAPGRWEDCVDIVGVFLQGKWVDFDALLRLYPAVLAKEEEVKNA